MILEEAVVPLIEKQLWFENRPGMFGYPVLNGLNFAEEMVKVWSVPSGAEVVLASDGYPQLCQTRRWKRVKRNCGRLSRRIRCVWASVVERLKGIMKGMESFDDRTYVRVIA